MTDARLPASNQTSMALQIWRIKSGLMLGVRSFSSRAVSCGQLDLKLATVLLFCIASSVSSALAQSDSHPLEGKSFSVRSTVRSTSGAKGDAWYTSRVHEVYSVGQARGRLSIRQTKANAPAASVERSFYMDQRLNLAVMIGGNMSEGVKCKESSLKALNKLLYQDNPLPSERLGVNYIVGPAQLLFVVHKNRDKMKTSPRGIRGLSAMVLYKFELVNERNIKIYFTVAYESQSIHGSSDDPPLPIEIVMDSGDSQTTIVRYSQITILQANSVPETSAQLLDGDVTLDPLAFPAGFGCARSLAKKAGEYLFESRTMIRSDARFSFRAEATYEGNAFRPKMFVAFASQLESLRVDLMMPVTGLPVVSRQLFNFVLNRMYHLMDREGIASGLIEDNDNDLVADNEAAGILGADGRTQCILAAIQPRSEIDKYARPYSLGQLLVGGDTFVYLGRAQVRGLDALVYESEDAAIPFWLDQPVVYSSQQGGGIGKDTMTRKPSVGADQSTKPMALRTVLYFGHKNEDHPLLMIELYRATSPSSDNFEKRTIHVHDFVWELSEAPNGDQPPQLFSLEDLCSANLNNSEPDANQYAKVKMLIETSEPANQLDNDDNPLLANAHDRDLAILAGLQESLHLPATMIYDLESRLVNPKEAPGASKWPTGTLTALAHTTVRVAFRVAQHPTNLVEAIYVGPSRASFTFPGAEIAIQVSSFGECFSLVAHRRRNTYFGYDMWTQLCIIDKETILGDPKSLEAQPPQLFTTMDHDQGQSVKVEVFRAQHTFESARAKEMKWIERSSRSSAMLEYLGSSRFDLKFKIREFQVDDSDRKSSLGVQMEGSAQQTVEIPDKLVGFGLVEDGIQTKRLAPKPLDSWIQASSYPQNVPDPPPSSEESDGTDFSGDASDSRAAMTFEQCQAACLSDLECGSFSVCVRRSQIECVVSKKSLRLTPKFVEQLQKERQANRGRSGEVRIIATNDDGQTLELALHPNCQLYSKHFLSLFARREPESLTLSQRELVPVRSRSDCAELCLKRNVEFLRAEVKRLANFSANVVENPMLAEAVLRERLVAIRERCESFRYLARSALAGSKQLEDQIYSAADKSARSSVAANQVEGYCIPGSVIMIGNQEAAPQERFYHFERYGFKTELLYERHYGVQLLNSPLLKDKKGSRTFEPGWQRKLIVQGENLQLKENDLTASGCARRCFFYGWGSPWPACRSFDLIQADTLDHGSELICVLNTLTLGQVVSANRTDLFERIGSSHSMSHTGRLVWHYEPRAGFALDESIFSGQLAAAIDRPWERISRQAANTVSHLGSQFGLFLVLLLAMVTGAIAGIKLGQSLLADQWPMTTRAQDKQRIIITDQVPSLEPAHLEL